MDAQAVTDDPLYFEDLDPDAVWTFGEKTLTRETIVDFAERYDPQPFHVDDAAAERSMFGELVASGLHTYCVCNAMATRAFFHEIAFLCGRGLEDFRWHRPVYPGDTLSGWVELGEMRVSESNPERGYVDVHVTGVNQDDEVVVSWTVLALVACREE
ncbi:Acyl dehydratase [Halogranum gelatinilyticum]|uniref:Acyl dehydratase n=1 Tax=Halogranum gelatinilyticum TaxID=660521 RepID=A0A1G9UGD4_9EURY|nr:MaoC/PaaZ C-terminal domain-containing protein [Halogranum gelatinilyticum]SDM58873.1 Acyl dehydratase [Halogranum gelatinilyticum]